jgi:hypothetical protein
MAICVKYRLQWLGAVLAVPHAGAQEDGMSFIQQSLEVNVPVEGFAPRHWNAAWRNEISSRDDARTAG